MRPTRRPFAKIATIYKTEKFISIETLSGGMVQYREDESYRAYLELEATDEVLGQVLLTALERSRSVDPSSESEFYEPERAMRLYQNWQKDFMHRYGYKTKRDAYKDMDWCLARLSEGKISIEPHRRYKPDHWKTLPPDKTVVISATDDAVTAGAALRLALNRCE